MKTIHVLLKDATDASYDVIIAAKLATRLLTRERYRHYVIIADHTSRKLGVAQLTRVLAASGRKVHVISFRPGEASKNWTEAGAILSKLVRLGTTRKSCIIAFGGGVVGDLAGFIASVYMRGIAYIQIPTTLLAMVDSSVGGKTGVDLPEGKNLAGAIWQPKQVLISLEALQTLPGRQWKSGMAEVIKYACIWDKKLFELLDQHMNRLRNAPQLLKKVIARCVEIKKEVVALDQHETKRIRSILNYGHTIGHAIEMESGFALTHGEAVAIGMHYEALVAQELGLLASQDVARQKSLLALAGLPTQLPAGMNIRKLITLMKHDKKSVDGQIRCALISRIGKPVKGYVADVPEVIMRKALGANQ